MKLAFAISGYVRQSEFANVESHCKSGTGTVEVLPDPRVPELLMRVAAKDVAEIRGGAVRDQFAGVQLILREGAQVERVNLTIADEAGMSRFHDPVLAGATARAIIASIFI